MTEKNHMSAAAQPPSKPDAWQYRCKPPGTDKWSNWRPCEDPRDVEDIAKHGKLAGYDAEARPLYAARPPAAPANLVQRCKELLSGGPMGFKADGPLIKALAAEIGGDIATAGALNKTIREALEVVAGQMVAAPVEKSGIMQAAANAAEKVASWSPSKREYAERVVGAPAASETCPNCKGTKRATYFSEQQMAHEERDCHLCRPRSSAGTAAPNSDFEQVFKDACDEVGCAYDNEALLSAIANLTSYVDMLWEWFRKRRGAEDMRANAADGGLSAEDFRQMLNEHEANLLPTEPQSVVHSGTYLGYRDEHGNEMHCANAFCPHQAECRKGCTSPVSRPEHS